MKKSKDLAVTCLKLLVSAAGAEFDDEKMAVMIIQETIEKANLPDIKINKIDFIKLLLFLNEKTGRKFTVVTPAVKSRYRDRLKEGYTKSNIVNAITNACRASHHTENGFQYLTIEFFSRAVTLDRYGYKVNKSKVVKKPQEKFTSNIPVE